MFLFAALLSVMAVVMTSMTWLWIAAIVIIVLLIMKRRARRRA